MSGRVSTLEAEHLSAAYAVWISAGWNDAYRLNEADFSRSWLASPARVGVWVNGELVGIGRANTDGVMYSMIHDVVVDPRFRGQGHGRSVVLALVQNLKAMGIRSIQLMSASGQVPFYAALGFRVRSQDRPGMEYAPADAQPGTEPAGLGAG